MNIKWILINQFGVNPKKFFRAIGNMPRYLKEKSEFKKSYSGTLVMAPCLSDWQESAGDTESEYFVQDLFVAQLVNQAAPVKHVDIGSRIDGFVAHIASYRSIEIFDIRMISSQITNVHFRQRDIMTNDPLFDNYTDSLSCLHSLEHFGLGRYGDPINPIGYIEAFKNMATMLKPDGTFYLSVPLGIERVEFNALRVFGISTIINLGNNLSLKMDKFYTLQDGKLENHPLGDKSVIEKINKKKYILGIFIFKKLTA
jgi:SAM-dependent methyltransferase